MQQLSIPTKKKRGWKFWAAFWMVAVFLLFSWAIFLQVRNHGFSGLLKFIRPVVSIMPTTPERKNELRTILDLIPELTQDNKERTILLLFQNNWELRPGGGFMGNFGIMKIKGERVTFIDTHDTNVFDERIDSNIEPPYPMAKMLKIGNWEMRDSNWSPDFPTNANKAVEFYHMEGGGEKIDGVVAVSTELLRTFLEVTGPVTIEGYPGEYTSENAIEKLEYQVEKGYIEQGIEPGKRKYIIKDLAKTIVAKAQDLGWDEKKELLFSIERHLNNKDVMVFFVEDNLQDKMRFVGWTGEMKNYPHDYLMMVDANLGSLKTDKYIKRSFEYSVDLTKEKPEVHLKITYNNTARTRDWMTKDYDTYLRVYVPEGSWLKEASGLGEQSYGNEAGKKFFGFLLNVPIGQQKTVEIVYDLPEGYRLEEYNLMIQKQSGVGVVPGKVTVIDRAGIARSQQVELAKDWVMNKEEK